MVQQRRPSPAISHQAARTVGSDCIAWAVTHKSNTALWQHQYAWPYLHAPCWFHVGCKKCVPKHCTLVGHYYGTYVWVTRGLGSNELAELTIAMLDFAANEPRDLPQKEVTVNIEPDGRVNDVSVKAIIGFDDDPLSPVRGYVSQKSLEGMRSASGEAREIQPLKQRLGPQRRTPVPGAFFPLFNQQQRALGGP